jgi:hypothetical protein
MTSAMDDGCRTRIESVGASAGVRQSVRAMVWDRARSRPLREGLARILEVTEFQIVASEASVEHMDLI